MTYIEPSAPGTRKNTTYTTNCKIVLFKDYVLRIQYSNENQPYHSFTHSCGKFRDYVAKNSSEFSYNGKAFVSFLLATGNTKNTPISIC